MNPAPGQEYVATAAWALKWEPGDQAPLAVGDTRLLERPALALFCSVACPGSVILQTYDLAVALRDSGTVVVSGFHSPMEKECLEYLLRGKQPVVICPARTVAGIRLPPPWRAALSDGRLLVLSPFGERQRRATAALARRRNEFVVSLATTVLICHAWPDSMLVELATKAIARGKPLFTLDSDEKGLVKLGAQPIPARDAAQLNRCKSASDVSTEI